MKTEWYPSSIKPVRPGLYEVLRPTFSVIPCHHMLKWTGYRWEYAYALGICGPGDVAFMCAGDAWRGLREPA